MSVGYRDARDHETPDYRTPARIVPGKPATGLDCLVCRKPWVHRGTVYVPDCTCYEPKPR